MNITEIKGKHSTEDKIIMIETKSKEAILLEDLKNIIRAFTKNELKRIRLPNVRKEIILGERPFLFEGVIKKIIEEEKTKELKIINENETT